ncbi:protein-glutamate methylesterase/protein-glutamine glutaminase [Photobacterium toruni]|uniref:protein-glutamate methylesterase/protein-glutamine glutaminase n=1 Tax=Photobacterium toruni TaxID=1935446 RepID=UPI00210FDF65|nr:chemotaxis response regulator protein-glutamate methylesterase [Photobacterium toruni]
MEIKVLVVDDSAFFRKMIVNMLESSSLIRVVGMATNGKEALDKVSELMPDVITMDIEMPVMDGVTAVKRIVRDHSMPILMLSSLTKEGTNQTLDALDAGASDFMLKNFKTVSDNETDFKSILIKKVTDLARRSRFINRKTNYPASLVSRLSSSNLTFNSQKVKPTTLSNSASNNVKNTFINRPFRHSARKYDLLVIGSSTGGPVALQQVLMKLPANFPCPILLAQHMPALFTTAFAERLDTICNIKVKEAQSGDILKPGVAYLAPGGRQMTLEGRQKVMRLKVSEDAMGLNYAPCVDLLFTSVAKTTPDSALGILLTGMGSDGCEGARLMKENGSVIWSQDKESCVVYGMPQAVEKAGISSEVFDIKKMGENISHEISA